LETIARSSVIRILPRCKHLTEETNGFVGLGKRLAEGIVRHRKVTRQFVATLTHHPLEGQQRLR
jgi:hypothetical protein